MLLAGFGCLAFLGLYLSTAAGLAWQDRSALARMQVESGALHQFSIQYYRLRAVVAEHPQTAALLPDEAPPSEDPAILSLLAPAAGAPDRVAAELALLRQRLDRLSAGTPAEMLAGLPDWGRIRSAFRRALDRIEGQLPALRRGESGAARQISTILRDMEPGIQTLGRLAMQRLQVAEPAARRAAAQRLDIYRAAALLLGLTFVLVLGYELIGARRSTLTARHVQWRATQESEAKSIFLATVSHEVRTPLNAISGFAELIQRQPFGPIGHQKYLEYTQDIIASTAHLRGLLDDVTDAQLVLDGQISLQEEEVRLRPFLAETLRIVRANAAERYLPPRIETRVTATVLRADRRRLRQVLINLLTNSIRYSEGQADILITAVVKGDALEIAVRDHGLGIPQSFLERVFEPFQRGVHPSGRGAAGMGLGLTIVRNIVQAHGGTVDIASSSGEGTTVTLRLPADRLVGDRPTLPSRLQGIAAE